MKSEAEIKALFLEIYNDLKHNPPLNEMVQHDLLVRLKTLRDVLCDDEIEKSYQDALSILKETEDKLFRKINFEKELIQNYFPNA